MAKGKDNKKIEKVEVELTDDVGSLIAFLKNLEGELIELYVPAGAFLFQNQTNLELLKESIEKEKKKILIFTDDQMGQSMAAKVGFEVKPWPSVDLSQEKEEKPEPDLTKSHPPLEAEATFEEGLSESLGKKILFPEPKFLPARKAWVYISGFVLATITIAFLVGYFILPSAQLIIEPRRIKLPLQAVVTADITQAEANPALSLIPAQLLRVEKSISKHFEATGRKEIKNPARGKITIYNGFSSEPQTLVAGTRFISKEGKLFCLKDRVVVPGAKVVAGKIVESSLEVEVYSGRLIEGRCQVAYGQEYNIGPSEFSIPGFRGTAKFEKIYGRSNQAMRGGFEGIAQVVSQEDLDRARDVFQSESLAALEQELKSRLPENLLLVEGALVKEVKEEKVSPGVGELAERFTISAKFLVAALVFNPKDVEKIFEFKLKDQMTAQQFIENKNQFEFTQAQIDLSAGKLTFEASGERFLTSKIDSQSLKAQLLGKNEKEVREVLTTIPSIESARLKLSPFWLKKIPSNPDKLKVIIK